MDRELKRNVLLFRFLVLGLAAFYFVEGFFDIEDPSLFGWQFRFLTIWGLTMSLVAGYLMVRRSLGRTTKRFEIYASATAVVNMIVVLMYWKIFLADPTAFYEDGVPIVWWREYYLHVLGPVLQWIDCFFILRAFRQPLKTLGVLVGISLSYVAWIELVIRPLNPLPEGSVTTGLPYRFLNNMEFSDRVGFYGGVVAMDFVFLILGLVIAWIVRRISPA